MKIFSRLLIVAAAFGSSLATTVIPPSFDELVGEAEMIFEGTVTGVHSQWAGEGGQRRIVTYVTFKVNDSWKGRPGAQYTLRMLGGTVDGEKMEVTDAPKFKMGDRDVLFVQNNGTQFIPLVGIMHGRFHVRKDSNGREVVHDNNDAPVISTTQVGKESVTASAAAPLSLLQFRQAVQARLGVSLPQP